MSEAKKQFHVLVCIDGSQASYQGLRYALKFSVDHSDTDISLLYIRPNDRSGSSEGLNMDMARENMLEWDLELPSLRALKKARNILVERGFLDDEWQAEELQKKSRGSRLGDHVVSYLSAKTGQHISLVVRVSSSVLAGILDEAHENHYDLVVVSASDYDSGGPGSIDNYTAVSVATEHNGTVILARELEAGHGHFVCITNAEASVKMALKDAAIAARCGCPIYLYAVAESEDKRKQTEETMDAVKEALSKEGFEVADSSIEVGDPAGRIIEHGKKHSLIVMAATEKSRLQRIFMGSISHEVLKKAKNSVMIIR